MVSVSVRFFTVFSNWLKKMQASTVLIVEHDERVCRVLSRIIKRMGYVPFPAGNYEDFKALYAEQQPAAILLNLGLPGNDHTEFFRYLVEQHSAATIILLCDLEENETGEFIQLGRSAGLNMGGALRKPVDVDAVKKVLQERVSPLKKSSVNRQTTAAAGQDRFLDLAQFFKNRISLILM